VPNSDSIVTVNVGGKRFSTTMDTLTRGGGNFVSTLISTMNASVHRDRKGNPFIDRSPEYFKVVLDYLRSGVLCIPSGVDKKRLSSEFDYYGIQITEPEEDFDLTADEINDLALKELIKESRERLFFPQLQSVSKAVRRCFVQQAACLGSSQIQCSFIPTVDYVLHTVQSITVLSGEQSSALRDQWLLLSKQPGIVCDDTLYENALRTCNQLSAFMKRHSQMTVEVREGLPKLIVSIDGNVLAWRYTDSNESITLFDKTITVKWSPQEESS